MNVSQCFATQCARRWFCSDNRRVGRARTHDHVMLAVAKARNLVPERLRHRVVGRGRGLRGGAKWKTHTPEAMCKYHQVIKLRKLRGIARAAVVGTMHVAHDVFHWMPDDVEEKQEVLKVHGEQEEQCCSATMSPSQCASSRSRKPIGASSRRRRPDASSRSRKPIGASSRTQGAPKRWSCDEGCSCMRMDHLGCCGGLRTCHRGPDHRGMHLCRECEPHMM